MTSLTKKEVSTQLVCGVCVILISLCQLTSAWSVAMDTEADLFRNWEIDGDYTYISKGEQLENSPLKDFLPPDFDYKEFRDSVGIWSILPAIVDDNKVNAINATVKTTASFSFQSSTQLMAFVTVTYCMYGDARIYIKKGFTDTSIFTIDPSESHKNKWAVTSVPIDLSSRFDVEAVVQGPTDFIFIDRIEGSYMEVTTKPTTTTTTTTTSTTTTTTTTTPTTTTPSTPTTTTTTTTTPETTTAIETTTTTEGTTTSAPTAPTPTPTATPIVSQAAPNTMNTSLIVFLFAISALTIFIF